MNKEVINITDSTITRYHLGCTDYKKSQVELNNTVLTKWDPETETGDYEFVKNEFPEFSLWDIILHRGLSVNDQLVILSKDNNRYFSKSILINLVRKKMRLDLIENILQDKDTGTPIDDEEIMLALNTALAEINASGNYATNYTMQQVFEASDNRYLYILILGACSNVAQTLYTHFAHSGFDLDQITQYKIHDKTDSLKSLWDSFNAEFKDRIEKLKKSTERKTLTANVVVKTGIFNPVYGSYTFYDAIAGQKALRAVQ